ncbi:signal peptide peptidase SppA [Microlunatus flavus]|uniref:Protease-4 n=1 Tax=Microlunatus flavus TaxID=1036181 RepID=A0A1H9ANT5_9ACTN|nr:signal peptide peptidase SppA [Microlunatus flavus]SEP78329.1 protease-4 [Microlunatus flavus]
MDPLRQAQDSATRGSRRALPGTGPLLLEIDLTVAPADPAPGDPLARLSSRGRPQRGPLLRALHEAGSDRRVVGLVAKVGGTPGWAAAQELREGVAAFAATGKPTVAWAETFSAGGGDLPAYVLASAFDEVWLQPSGDLALLGVAVETTFLRGALDKLGVEPEIEGRHEYKNAVDRISRTGLTDAHRESLERLSGSLLDRAVADVARGRGLAVEEVRRLVDTGPRTATEARAAGLVDRLGYRDEVYASVRERVGERAELLFADRWRPRRKPALPSLPGRPRGHVALVEVRGGIVSGASRRGPMGPSVGSDTVSADLRAVLDDDAARAVVLHVDSPGGSSVASDTIWREVCRVRESGRPVVVSMGSVAASGGYYVACPADVVVALPATLTGSIGVFGGKFVVSELLERLGLSTGAVEQGARARMYSSRRPFTDEERERLDASLDQVYEDFTRRVADGRGLSREAVEAVARGRVWTGADAQQVGLVDELGGLHEAVRIARERADLPVRAPVRPARHVAPLARLGRPRNSEDPRTALVGTGLGDLDRLAAVLGLPTGAALRMPSLSLG